VLPIHTILHPTDLSEESAGAFRIACALARHYSARLVLVSVFPPPFNGAEAVDRTRPGRIEDDLLAKLKSLKPDDPAVRVEYQVEEGWPAEAILGVADRIGADLIVMGTHGRGGAARMLMGSVAEKVNRKATCPVLAVGQGRELGADRATPSRRADEGIAEAGAGSADLHTSRNPGNAPRA
jgi:nucleotide-binding universal stress UspA family protein